MVRLPVPGADDGDWGTLLNTYLGVAHKSDGTLKDSSVTEVSLDGAVQAKLNAGGSTSIGQTRNATSVSLTSSTGSGTVLTAATVTDAGVFPATDKTKLDGIAAGATANSSDATLINRANHTGVQAISTVSGLQAVIDAKAPLASPALTGSPTAPTLSPGTNTTGIATTAFVQAAATANGISLVNALPGSMYLCPWNGTAWTYGGTALASRPSVRADIYFIYAGAPSTQPDPAWALTGDQRIDV